MRKALQERLDDPEFTVFIPLDEVAKHQPGKHNQKTHGSWAGTGGDSHWEAGHGERLGERQVNSKTGEVEVVGYKHDPSETQPQREIRWRTAAMYGQGPRFIALGAKHYDAPTVEENQARMKEFGIDVGTMGECFANAGREIIMKDTPGLTYVEGFATTDRFDFTTQHAWLVTDDGRVIDPTWSGRDTEVGKVNPGIAYYGIPFTNEFVREQALRTEVWGILQGPSGGPVPVSQWVNLNRDPLENPYSVQSLKPGVKK